MNARVFINTRRKCAASAYKWAAIYKRLDPYQVTINGKMSNTKLIDKGVPQGSILGPPLFTIFINDFPSCLSTVFCNSFADDAMIGVKRITATDLNRNLNDNLTVEFYSTGALVQWLKLPGWKDGDRELEPHSGLQVPTKKMFPPR